MLSGRAAPPRLGRPGCFDTDQFLQPVEAEAIREELADMELELRVAQVREEIALALPHVAVRPLSEEAAALKKRPARAKRRARPGWWKK